MAQNVVINGITYQDVPFTQIAKVGGGFAVYYDTEDATLESGNQMLNGITAYSNGVKYTGSISSKTAQTYTPTTSDQTISSGQYLSGAQTIKGDQNLIAGNIRQGVTLFNVTGTLSSATITQDPVTKVLTIS